MEKDWSFYDREHVVCDLCGADHPVLWFEKESFRYVRCHRCGLVYVTPRLRGNLEAQDDFYDRVTGGDLDDAAERDRHPKRLNSLAKAARSYQPYKHIGILLDVGCGFGAFLEAAKSEGWNACGVEVSPKVASIAARRHEVFCGFLSEAPYDPNSFAAVRLNNVIEHTPSPRGLVRDIHRVLRPGGLLSISTPNVDSFSVALQGAGWRYIGGQSHIYLFGPKTLERLLQAEGFKVVRIFTRGIHLTHKDRRPGAYPSLMHKLTRQPITWAERLLDLGVQVTLRGHRLRVWAEKVV